jgi:hypothetical protein
MAKKTSNKELKPKAEDKKEVAKVEVPKTKTVKIVLNKDKKTYSVGYKLACELVEAKKAKLA